MSVTAACASLFVLNMSPGQQKLSTNSIVDLFTYISTGTRIL